MKNISTPLITFLTILFILASNAFAQDCKTTKNQLTQDTSSNEIIDLSTIKKDWCRTPPNFFLDDSEKIFLERGSSKIEAIQSAIQKAKSQGFTHIAFIGCELKVHVRDISKVYPVRESLEYIYEVKLFCQKIFIHKPKPWIDEDFIPKPILPIEKPWMDEFNRRFDCKRTSFLETPPTSPETLFEENQKSDLLSYRDSIPFDPNEIIAKIEKNRSPEGCILPQIGEIVSLEISSKVAPRRTAPKPEYPNQTKPNKKSRRDFDENDPFDPRYTDPAPTQPFEDKKWPKECESCTMPNLIIPSYWDEHHQNCKCECHKKIWAKSQPLPVPIDGFDPKQIPCFLTKISKPEKLFENNEDFNNPKRQCFLGKNKLISRNEPSADGSGRGRSSGGDTNIDIDIHVGPHIEITIG